MGVVGPSIFFLLTHRKDGLQERLIAPVTLPLPPLVLFFKFYLFNLFIFWLFWVFFAACGLPLVAVSGGYS